MKQSALTVYQNEVLHLVLQGCSNREIAANLGETEAQIERCLAQLFTKLHVTNRVELLLLTFSESRKPRGLSSHNADKVFRIRRGKD